MLTALSDLPGTGWVQLSEKVFRMGKLGEVTDRGIRSGKAGYFFSTRAFEQPSAGTWLVSQVFPFVSAQDASLALANFSVERNVLLNSKFEGEIVELREVPNVSVNNVDAVRIVVVETKTETKRGYQYVLNGVVGSVVFAMFFTRVDVPVTMEVVDPIAQAQVSKLSS